MNQLKKIYSGLFEFSETNQTYLYHSYFYSAAPITNSIMYINDSNSSDSIIKTSYYTSASDRFIEQQNTYNDWAEVLWIDITVNDNGKKKDGNLKIATICIVFIMNILHYY